MTFEVLAVFLERARTATLEVPPDEDAPRAIITNMRAAVGLPSGYTTATLRRCAAAPKKTRAVALVQQAKVVITADYAALHGRRAGAWRPAVSAPVFSDVRRVGYRHIVLVHSVQHIMNRGGPTIFFEC
jgi:hypothetical protein